MELVNISVNFGCMYSSVRLYIDCAKDMRQTLHLFSDDIDVGGSSEYGDITHYVFSLPRGCHGTTWLLEQMNDMVLSRRGKSWDTAWAGVDFYDYIFHSEKFEGVEMTTLSSPFELCEDDSDNDEEGSESEHDEGDEGDEGMYIEQIKNPSTTVVMLKAELSRLGLSQSGRKHLLVERLVQHHLKYLDSIDK